MAIFHVVRQKHVVLPNSELFWAEIWTNGDIPCGSSETCGFFKLGIILGLYLEKWRYFRCFVRNIRFFQTRNNFGLKFGQTAIFGLNKKNDRVKKVSKSCLFFKHACNMQKAFWIKSVPNTKKMNCANTGNFLGLLITGLESHVSSKERFVFFTLLFC